MIKPVGLKDTQSFLPPTTYPLYVSLTYQKRLLSTVSFFIKINLCKLNHFSVKFLFAVIIRFLKAELCWGDKKAAVGT